MKTLPKILHLSVLLLALLAHDAWGVEIPTGAPVRVGNLGEPARVSIAGTQIFTEDEVRRALGTDLDYLVAAHPEATLSECLTALEARIHAGYRDTGFRDVVVQVRFDVPAGRIVAKVTEGPRFRCGTLRVTGLKAITVADFTCQFAKKLAPASEQNTPYPGLWKAGMPASFTGESLANYIAAASNTFAALGRFAPTFKIEIQPQPADTNAALAVIVADEGPAAVLRDIEVVGNQKNRRDDVIGFLGLAKGMKLTQDLIDEKTRALTQAARLVDASITPTVFGSGGQVLLRVAVIENDHLPSLQQPLSREEKTLLRLRDWLLAWESRPDDLIVEWIPPTAQSKWPLTYLPGQGWSATSPGQKPPRFEVILAPTGGIMARVIENSPGQAHPQDLYSVVIKAEAMSVFAQVHQRKLHIPLPPGNSGLIFVRVERDANATDKFKLTMGAGLSPAQANGNWRLRLEFLPAAFTDLLYRPDAQATWEGDVLTVRTKHFVLRVEEETGRLLEAESMVDQPASGAITPEDYRQAIRFTAGAFAKAQDQIVSSTSTHPDVFQSQRAYGSALGFLAAEVALAEPLWNSPRGGSTPEPKKALASALEKLLASSFLDPFQKLLDAAKPPRSVKEFAIPSKPAENQDATQQAFERVMVWCAGHAQELTPADSWLQTLLRELAFEFNSRTEHQAAALARLTADQNLGPIGCFAALHAFPAANRDWQATIWDLGLRRMTTDDFHRDYRMLLDPGSAMTHCLANLARELGTLTAPEVEAITGLLPPDSAAFVREMASAARQAKDRPVSDAIGPALDRWWQTTGRVEADFRSHAQPSAQAMLGQPRPNVETPTQIELTGEPAPEFTLPLLEGGSFDLASHQGKDIVLLDFWATWCGPCRVAMPALVELAREYADKGVRYFAVNLREEPAKIRSYLRDAGLQIAVPLDKDGSVARQYGVTGIPTMVIVDKDGVVEKVHVGSSPGVKAELARALDDLLAGKKAGTAAANPLRPTMPIPPRPESATAEMVDLTEFYDAALGESWHPNSRGNDLARLPSGVQEMQGVRFDIRGIVQLNGGGASDKQGQPFPRRVPGIKIGRKCARFHFLHAAGWSVDDGTVVGRYIIRYVDGSNQTLPIIYGEDVRDWWVGAEKVVALKNAQVAWQGEATNGNAVRLYQRRWENPSPDLEVASIEFSSTMTRCAPFLLAITTEP